jgi:ABC transport system ATP-binding/permease protein
VKGILLVVKSGPNAGLRVDVSLGHYRVVGRGESWTGGTAIQPRGEQRRLEREDQKLASEHLLRRASPGMEGARAEVAAFVRGEDIDLSDEAVSQTHAMLFCDEAGASVVDVASTNGTYVNGEKLTESALVSGDLLRIGETRFEVQEL